MKLHAILCWYDEPPTWLASCVASLSRIGVDHLIAVDGRYPHFSVGSPTNSRIDQVDTITSTAIGCGMSVTLHRLLEPVNETEKRSLAFRLLNASAALDDWVIVIDADELITDGDPFVKRELAELDESILTAACRVTNAIDPYARPETDNDVSDKTLEIHQKFNIPSEFQSAQSRLWRVMRDMRVEGTHYAYTGVDRDGVRWNLRPDIGGSGLGDMPRTEVARLDSSLTIEHRKNHRTIERRDQKHAYYQLRDELGIERVAT